MEDSSGQLAVGSEVLGNKQRFELELGVIILKVVVATAVRCP